MPNDDAIYIKTRDALSPLKPILQKWAELVIRYSNAFAGKDACYWYNERANIGVLAAAAWQAEGEKWLALEEYGTQKRHGVGRCDLYVANKTVSFAVEAKLAWQNIGDRVSAPYQQISEKWGQAWTDTGELHKDEADHRVLACFIAPRFPASGKDVNLAEWREGLAREFSPDALAWVFPESSASLRNSRQRIYPGVCLLLQTRKRANPQ
ncbi:MAG: hypothetical protein LBD68_03070 [Zoogloeaceae bacterium]|jgi:hypothetical protein|nr:hypothetical protein [Zoogloeaceae bacterium]